MGDNEDFFDYFKNKPICKKKRFNFKQVIANKRKQEKKPEISEEFKSPPESPVLWSPRFKKKTEKKEKIKEKKHGDNKNFVTGEEMNKVLQQKFGLIQFKQYQKEIIDASLNTHRDDCFVLMPTGYGKTLCYQLPAILMSGVTIVISPLRALITEQVDKLKALDIQAAHLCSDVKNPDVDLIFEKLDRSDPVLKLLYLPPKKISASGKVAEMIKSLYSSGKLTRFVIDEAHCISQRGHNFESYQEEIR